MLVLFFSHRNCHLQQQPEELNVHRHHRRRQHQAPLLAMESLEELLVVLASYW
jgi:hypothetical protein